MIQLATMTFKDRVKTFLQYNYHNVSPSEAEAITEKHSLAVSQDEWARANASVTADKLMQHEGRQEDYHGTFDAIVDDAGGERTVREEQISFDPKDVLDQTPAPGEVTDDGSGQNYG